jgi:hypothetical protein
LATAAEDGLIIRHVADRRPLIQGSVWIARRVLMNFESALTEAATAIRPLMVPLFGRFAPLPELVTLCQTFAHCRQTVG